MPILLCTSFWLLPDCLVDLPPSLCSTPQTGGWATWCWSTWVPHGIHTYCQHWPLPSSALQGKCQLALCMWMLVLVFFSLCLVYSTWQFLMYPPALLVLHPPLVLLQQCAPLCPVEVLLQSPQPPQVKVLWWKVALEICWWKIVL